MGFEVIIVPDARTEQDVVALNATKVVGIEVGVERAVDVNLSATAGAVGCYSHVMPIVVVEGA